MLARKRVIRSNKAKLELVQLLNALTNFETRGYYQNETRFNGLISRNSSLTYVIDWLAICIKNKEVIYFDSFGIEHISGEIKKIYRYQKY